jgi:elongation factor Ts
VKDTDMPSFTAADVKRLRDMTGSGMMACKNALTEADGDFDKAVELLRIKGAKDVGKRLERAAANGLVLTKDGAMIELNCETDFVAKNAGFQDLAGRLIDVVVSAEPADVSALLAQSMPDGNTVAQTLQDESAKIGEKLEITRFVTFDGTTASYLHRKATDLPPAIGVLVQYEGDSEETAKSVAMQVAASRPKFLAREEVPAEVVDSERRIAEQTAREEGKPEQAMSRIIEGRVGAFFKDFVLLEQPSITDPKRDVAAVLSEAGVAVLRFARFEVGQP